ncbi:IS3 family transposase [Corynebacterium macginleyi]|uniref:IS3 family transposase n=1 Tax=Corynebacterium macginleyi TaxID=38290 RepID=UPI00190C93B0|nr:IS3 family transposase [Corynebacterium macginleyi]
MIRFQFVYDHRTEYSVKRMCKVLKLNRSSFYKWVNTREKRRLKMCSDALIGAKIKAAFDDEHGLYGSKRIAASLNSDTDFGPINHKKVARIMKSMGLQRLYQAAPMHHYQAQAWPPCHAGFARP